MAWKPVRLLSQLSSLSLLPLALYVAACSYSPDTIGTPPYTKGYTPGGSSSSSSSSNVGGSSNVGSGPIGSTSSSSELMQRIKNNDGSNP